MTQKSNTPSSSRFQRKFRSDSDCIKHLAAVKWPRGYKCPVCGCKIANQLTSKPCVFMCCTCNHQDSVTAGTFLHNTKIPLVKWFKAAAYFLEWEEQGTSIGDLSKKIDLSRVTSWRMLHKLRRSYADPDTFPLMGVVEVGEIYYGGGHTFSDSKIRPDDEIKERQFQYSAIAGQVNKEDTLINNRLTWTLMINGFLFAGLGILAKGNQHKDIVELMRQVIPYIGIAANLAGFFGAVAAIRQIRYLKQKYELQINGIYARPYGGKWPFKLGFAGPIIIPIVLLIVWAIFTMNCTDGNDPVKKERTRQIDLWKISKEVPEAGHLLFFDNCRRSVNLAADWFKRTL